MEKTLFFLLFETAPGSNWELEGDTARFLTNGFDKVPVRLDFDQLVKTI